MNVNDKIKLLIPHFGEDLITIPLYEEGNISPQVNIWKIYNELPMPESEIELTQFSYNWIPEDIIVYMSIEKITRTREEYEEIFKDFAIDKEVFNIFPEESITYHVKFSICHVEDNASDLELLLDTAYRVIEFFK